MTRSTTAPAAPLPSPKERRRLREARALSEEQVASAVGVTPATVRAWETGRMNPRGRRRAAYARVIGFAGHRGAPPSSVEATGSGTTPPAESGTGPATDTPATLTPEAAAQGAPAPGASGIPAQDASAPGTTAPEATAPDGNAPDPTAPEEQDPPPQPRLGLTAEEAYDALYGRTAPGLTRQMYLLTGRRELSREAVEHAFRIAWQRWPEVARDRDPAGWVRAASYEYAMSPWHRLRRAHRRADSLPDDPARRGAAGCAGTRAAGRAARPAAHDGVGLGLPETAAETEASTPAAANRLLNARATVAGRLPAPSGPEEPGGGSAVLRERLGALALAEEVPEPPPATAVRAGSERVAGLWTRAALCFGALLIGTTAFTLHTAPTRYEQPLAPAERVGGVPPRGGPEKLTPQDLKLQKSLRGELTHGPERLVPRIP